MTNIQATAAAPSAKAAATLQVGPDGCRRFDLARRPRRATRGEGCAFCASAIATAAVSGAELQKTAYLTNGTRLERLALGPGQHGATNAVGIGPREGRISLVPGDLLVFTRDPAPGRSASFDSAHQMLSPARVSRTLMQGFASVNPEDRVSLDDGKIDGVIESASPEELRIRVRRTPPRGARLRADTTDAAMGHCAECVMLKKGPHVQQALCVLDDILKRMEAHQSKKRAMLRALRIATEFTVT